MIVVNKKKEKNSSNQVTRDTKKTDFYLFFSFYHFFFALTNTTNSRCEHSFDEIENKQTKLEKKIFFQNKLCLPHKHNNYTNTHKQTKRRER